MPIPRPRSCPLPSPYVTWLRVLSPCTCPRPPHSLLTNDTTVMVASSLMMTCTFARSAVLPDALCADDADEDVATRPDVGAVTDSRWASE